MPLTPAELNELFKDLWCPILGIMSDRPVATWTARDWKLARAIYDTIRPYDHPSFRLLLRRR
jgi:hypothetical protein